MDFSNIADETKIGLGLTGSDGDRAIAMDHNLGSDQEEMLKILRMKYAQKGELTRDDVRARVAKALGKDDAQRARFLYALRSGLVMGGRINAAAGSDISATMINCFVQPCGDSVEGVDKDGVPGIAIALGEAMATLRRGGGVGYDFSRLRPRGAHVGGTNSSASGPVSYMRMFDRMCETIESAGSRRGAQMAVLRIDHPDIEEFIDAKKTPDFATMGLQASEVDSLMDLIANRPAFGWKTRKAFATLSNFNISCGITDDFMKAVVDGTPYDLVHEAKPGASSGIRDGNGNLVTTQVDGKQHYVYRRINAADLWKKILRNAYDCGDPGGLFVHRINRANNLRYCETISATNPCGEQVLPSYGCCCLGSLDLGAFVSDPFTDKATFNTSRFREIVSIGVEMLDRVLDVTKWPLAKQHQEAQDKRRIGLGYFGLADAMAMLNIVYGSKQSVGFTADVTRDLALAAYRQSIELAKTLDPFPLLEADPYLAEGTFASTLPEDIKSGIRTHGIRNSHLLSIAPTGTMAMAFGNNASSGIEPIFALRQVRHVTLPDSSKKEIAIENRAARLCAELGGGWAAVEAWGAFRTVENLTVDDHMAVLEAAAPYIDSAISKTVNIPVEYPFEDFERLYLRAWRAGLKGITVYRDNPMVGSVLASAKPKATTTHIEQDASGDPDRRVTITLDRPLAALQAIRHRPATPNGVDSRLFQIPHPHGEFAVVVSHWTNGGAHPLDIYIAGAEQPRGIAALAKLLSQDCRTEDSAWLQIKLESLLQTEADDRFEMTHPATGKLVTMPSLVAGFAAVVKHRLGEIGALNGDASASPMVDALFSRKEPKTGPDGALGWSVDISNPATGDDFLLHAKELRMPDGTIRPYSVWLSGRYPRALDGLTRALSIDMRISDPAWMIHKLDKLSTFAEANGSFMARVPGEERSQTYASTVSYMAHVLLRRLHVLGVRPISEATAAAMQPAVTATITGRQCPQCHAMTLRKSAGCDSCDNCGYVGSCG